MMYNVKKLVYLSTLILPKNNFENMTIDIHRYITIKHKMLIILKSCEHNNFCDLYVLTTTVDTLLGNTLAVIAKSAVM